MNTYRVVGSNSQSKWVGDKATGRRVPLYKGKTVELTEAEAAELGPKRVTLATELGTARTAYTAGKVDPIAEDQPGALPNAEPPATADDDAEVLAGNAKNVAEFIELEDDPAAIRRLITAEKAGKNRDSVIKAATARLGELGKAK
jgi:hypothetical protein